jgi:lipopolysaccharide/colanic/teichoic acid biosynthesis glycosyltransferase
MPDRRADVSLRALDLVVAIPVALALTPVMIMLAVMSAVALRAWPLFVQSRPGAAGRTLRMIKIRTLPVDTPHYACKTTIDHDRVPALMRFLRGTHLDELPQLWQVITGHLSIVGPRPRQAEEVDAFAPDFEAVRRSVRPGCTGLWQISPSSVEGLGDSPEYDLFWVSNRSVRMALWVLYRTIAQTVWRARPVSLSDVPAWTMPPPRSVALTTTANPRHLTRARLLDGTTSHPLAAEPTGR